MKILVTGGSGLVGKAIQEVISESQEKNNVFKFLSSKDCNLTIYDQVYKLFLDWTPDIVIHLACNVGGLFKNIEKKIEMFEDNLLINFNVLKCCRLFKVKKILSCLSTCVFPDKISYPINETMLHDGAPHPSNYGYAYVKRNIEIQTSLYAECLDMEIVNLIPTNIYGKYDNFNLEESHVIPALIRKAYLSKTIGKKFIVKGSGEPIRQFLYSKDFAKIILLFLEKKLESKFNNIIVTSKEEVSIKEVALKLVDIFKLDENLLEFDENFSDGQFKKTASNKKLMKIIPHFNFTRLCTGLVETIFWFQKNYPNVRL